LAPIYRLSPLILQRYHFFWRYKMKNKNILKIFEEPLANSKIVRTFAIPKGKFTENLVR